MEATVLDPVGVHATGIDLAEVDDLDAAAILRLRHLLADHGVVVFGDQALDDAAFLAFLSRFGQLTFSTGETPVEGFPDLNVISNVGRDTPPRSTFHVDTSYVRHPPAYTALRAVTIPEQGGETLFTDQYRAYETLAPQVREQLAGRTIEHVVTGLELGEDDEKAARHPIFRQHPVSGRTTLYLTTPTRCADVSGMEQQETRDTIDFLYAHSTQPELTYRHAWSPGDVVMWDNGCVLHRADHADVVGDRVMHRGMVLGYAAQDAGTTAAAG